jgi:hypothetical protein
MSGAIAAAALTATLLSGTSASATVPAEAAGARQDFTLAKIGASHNDLAGYQAVDRRSGAVIRIYYEPAAQKLAERYLPHLLRMIREVAAFSNVDAGRVLWASVVFSANADYVPPRTGGEVRWSVLATNAGELTREGETMLFSTLPHEQVHAVQKVFFDNTPRWFQEGQAAWVGLQVSRRLGVRPGLSEEWRSGAIGAAAAMQTPLNLAGWGGMQVKPEALLRQMSPEDRARKLKDPGFRPTGPFSFKPDDLISDESNTLARYGGALRFFEQVRARYGRRRMDAWIKAVWKEPKQPGTPRLLELARHHLGEDVTEMLK